VAARRPPGCPPDVCECGPPPVRSKHAPLYSFNHPTVQRIKLPAVKTELYNPGLASLRRYDMDNVTGKPPEEHSQITTTLCLGEFRCSSSIFVVDICDSPISSLLYYDYLSTYLPTTTTTIIIIIIIIIITTTTTTTTNTTTTIIITTIITQKVISNEIC